MADTPVSGFTAASEPLADGDLFGVVDVSDTSAHANGTTKKVPASTVKTYMAPAESAVSFTDITTNNASTTKHGYLPKLSNIATEFLNGQGAWATPAGGGGGGSGDVVGPATATDNGLAKFDGTTGELLKDGPIHATGSWTPTLTFGTVNGTHATSTCAGNYTRIGDRVMFDMVIIFTTLGTSTGALTIGNMPFTAAVSAALVVRANAVLSTIASLEGLWANTTTNSILYYMSSGTATQVTHSQLTGTTSLIISGVGRI